MRSIVKIVIPYIPYNLENLENLEILENDLREHNRKNILFIGTLNTRRTNILNNLKNHIVSQNLDYNLLIFQKFLSISVQQHLSGAQNRRLLIWSLLNVEQYLKETTHG